MSKPIKIPITDSIFHYITCDAVQRRRIEETELLFGGLNIKIRTGKYSPLPTLCLCPKITHAFEAMTLCRPIVPKYLCE